MNKTTKFSVTVAVALAAFSVAGAAFAQVAPQVQTQAATNIVNNQATLNGYLSSLNGYGSATVWFQYGTTGAYGSQTAQVNLATATTFSQIVSGLQQNTTYYFEAVAQTPGGITYGQQMTFYTNNNGNNNGTLGVQTYAATNVTQYQATLNGYLSGTSNLNSTTYLWFQYGVDTNYGSTSGQQTLSNSGSFSQTVSGLTANTTYHYRAVSQNGGIIQYGQDMTFYTTTNGNNGSCYYVNGVYTCGGNNNNCYYVNNVYTCGGNNYGNGTMTVTEQVINLTSGNLNWQNSVNANPNDLLSFAITIQPNGSEIDNVNVRDLLPAGLIYRGNLKLNTSNLSGDITQGINIGSVYANQPVIVSFQAQATSSNYGTIANPITVTSSNGGTQTATSSVYMTNNASVLGAATYIDTGLTNNLLTDSFLLPLLMILAGMYLYFSGNAYKLADWIKSKQ
jgi:hypothetical protein